MRCCCCDNLLTDYETSIKNQQTGFYEDTCLKCLKGLNIHYKGNRQLLKKRDVWQDPLDLPQDDDFEDFGSLNLEQEEDE